MSYVVDARYAPIVIMDIGGGYSDADLESYIRELSDVLDEAIAKNMRLVGVVPNDAETSSADRSRIAAAHQALKPEQVARIVVSHVVARSAVVRGALTALRWLLPNKFGPVNPVASVEAAYAAALVTLTEQGMPVPSDLVGLRRALGLPPSR